MAVEIVVDDGGLDGYAWDGKAVGIHAAGLAAHTTGAAVRGGVLPAAGTPLLYVAQSLLVGRLKAGTYFLPNPSAALGGYVVELPTDFDITHTTAAGSTRIDLIIVEVADTGVAATSFKKFRLVTGTAGAGQPALPAPVGNGSNALLATVTINGSSTVINAITDQRQFTAGAGGAVPVTNQTAAAALTVGTPFHDLALDRPGWRRNAGAAPLMIADTAWQEAVKQPLGSPASGLTNTTFATLTSATASFTLAAGGLVQVSCLLDVTPSSAGYFLARIVGHPASKDQMFDAGGRQSIRPSCEFYAPAGTLSLFLEVAVFSGSATVTTAEWQVCAQGGVVAI